MQNKMNDNIVYWKQRNGVLISIDDMDINHLRNVLKMIVNNNQKVLQQPKVKFRLHGDMAQSFNDDMELYDMEAGITDIETGIL